MSHIRCGIKLCRFPIIMFHYAEQADSDLPTDTGRGGLGELVPAQLATSRYCDIVLFIVRDGQ